MQTLVLNGEWVLRKSGKGRKIPAMVPGDVYADLLRAGDIPDPFYTDNELNVQWIGETDWSYSRHFTVGPELLARRRILLRCDGLDTFAKVLINGHPLAETDNMFRTYEWDVKSLLKPGENTIRVDFSSVLPYIRSQQGKFPQFASGEHQVAYPGWVRKEQCNFGWDWGCKAVTCGIWRSISIIAFDEARIAVVEIRQEHGGQKSEVRGQRSEVRGQQSVGLTVHVSVGRSGRRGLQAKVSVRLKGRLVTEDVVSLASKECKVKLEITDPELWWPNGMGKQPLYDVTVELLDREGNFIDNCTKRIGLRTLTLDRHDDEWGESFQFVVNGVPFFAKGANWIPVDAILARATPERYRRLVEDAAAANMNMLRVWGGGVYEDDRFYDACDELGICVWQDFMFACAAYPTFLKDFNSSIREEARDAIRRLRHHPCMALWCGNNELEMMNVGDSGWKNGMMPWKAYKALFDGLLPKLVEELSPDIPYWPSSPHTPRGDRTQHRSPVCGDAHLWIMTGKEPFECARTMTHRFASEFGFQSFPEPETIATFTGEGDRHIASRVMELHQRAPNGNMTIIQQFLKCFRMPLGFENTLWVSQILQGTAVKNACEHFRRNMPRTMGTLYWQLNDCWPAASWSSIDFNGRWKALHYMARNFFAPVLISGVEDRARGTVEIHLTSDRPAPLPATIVWTVTDIAGKVLEENSVAARTPVQGSRKARTLKLRTLLDRYGACNILVWLEARVHGEPVQRNLVLFAPPKYLELDRDPGIRSSLVANCDGSFSLTVDSSKVALWTWIELKGVTASLSNNFFHLRPGHAEQVCIRPSQNMTEQDLKESILIRSLVDTYQENGE